jgi:hypothetical protein
MVQGGALPGVRGAEPRVPSAMRYRIGALATSLARAWRDVIYWDVNAFREKQAAARGYLAV